MTTATDIIEYWYASDMQAHWFASTPDLDQAIKKRYESLWESAAAGELDHWKKTAQGCLALIIILDQFPLNMFRGQAKSFATERKAIETTYHAIKQKFDQQLEKDKLAFLLMPLMHSEKWEDQALSVKLYKQYQLTENIQFAEHHQAIIKTYGRFPHRNAILGRTSTA
ncbi:MAG: DUF924 family protein, partial [bacterium]